MKLIVNYSRPDFEGYQELLGWLMEGEEVLPPGILNRQFNHSAIQ